MYAKIALLVMLAACSVGEVPLGGGATPDAPAVDNSPEQMSFAAMIAPLVTECTACHATAVPPNLSSFADLEQKYKTKPGATNILVVKGEQMAGMHQGLPYFTEAEKTQVASWIESLP